jgi:hypothetical protein
MVGSIPCFFLYGSLLVVVREMMMFFSVQVSHLAGARKTCDPRKSIQGVYEIKTEILDLSVVSVVVLSSCQCVTKISFNSL